MKQVSEAPQTTDKVRYVIAGLILAVAVIAYYWFVDLPLVFRILIVLAGVGASVGVLWTSVFGIDTRKHLNDTQREVKQVVWPTREQAVRMTLIVFVAVFLVGLFLWLVDMFFLWGVQWLTGRGE